MTQILFRLPLIFICVIGVSIITTCKTPELDIKEDEKKAMFVSPVAITRPAPSVPVTTAPPVERQQISTPIPITQEKQHIHTKVPRITQTSFPPIPQGGNLNVAAPIWFSDLDPHKEASPSFAAWGPGLAYSRILKFQTGKNIKLPSLSTECDLCEEWHMEDQSTFVFQIQGDTKWQPSPETKEQKVTAYDVEFSLNRQKQDISVNSHIIHMIKSIKAESNERLKVILTHPDADLFIALANGKTKIISKDVFSTRPANLSNGPIIGSSPWRAEYRPDDETVILTKWNYQKITPYINSLKVMHIPDHQARKSAYMVKLIDIYQIEIEDLEEFSESQILNHPDPGVGLGIAFNTQTHPFDDISLRKAVMLAINPTVIIEQGWNSKAFFSLGYPVASQMSLTNPDKLRKYFNIPDSARNILSKEHPKDQVNITITSSDFGEEYLESLEIISSQLKSVGINTNFRMLDRRQYSLEAWKKGDYTMLVGPVLPQNSLNGYLLSTMHSSGPWNTTHGSDLELDQLIEAQVIEYDREIRDDLIQDIETHILEKGYRFMPATRKSTWSWGEDVGGFFPNFSGNEYGHWEKMWIKP